MDLVLASHFALWCELLSLPLRAESDMPDPAGTVAEGFGTLPALAPLLPEPRSASDACRGMDR